NQFHARSESSNQAYFHPEANAFCPPKDPGEPCDASRFLRCIGPATGSLPYFFSFLSGFSEPASAPSSSVSCLPFLITSGSAGPVAASAAAASGVAATSSFTDVTCATGWFGSVKNFSLGLG